MIVSLEKVLPQFLAEFFCLGRKYLVFNMVSRNLKTKYRRSVFGAFWTLLVPMGMSLVYFFVFEKILQVKIQNYLLFILIGVLPWNFFAQSLSEGLESVVGNGALITKVSIPVQIFSLVGTVTNFISLLLALPVLMGVFVLTRGFEAYSVTLSFAALVLWLGLLSLTYCLSLILSVAFVYFRDLRHILGIFLQIWFYGTPVLYDDVMIPERFRWILYANPLGGFFSGMHDLIYRGVVPNLSVVAAFFAWVLLFFGLAFWTQRALGQGLAENI